MQHFLQTVFDEVHELSASPFGQTLLTTIGRCYREHAVSELSYLSSMGVGMSQSSRYLRRRYHLASEGISTAYTASEVNTLQKTIHKDQQETQSEKETKELKKRQSQLRRKLEILSGHMFAVM